VDGIKTYRKLHTIWKINSENLQNARSHAVIMIPPVSLSNERSLHTKTCDARRCTTNPITSTKPQEADDWILNYTLSSWVCLRQQSTATIGQKSNRRRIGRSRL